MMGRVKLSSFLPAGLLLLLLPGCAYDSEQPYLEKLNQEVLTEYKVVDDKLYVLGILNNRTAPSLKKKLWDNPKVKTLVLTAMPGSIDDEANIPLGIWLHDKGYNTYLTSRSVIASGAVDLFAAGVERTIETGAQIGVHSWADGEKTGAQLSRSNPGHKLFTEFYKAIWGSDDFYWFTIEAAPADDIKWMTRKEIDQFGLATKWRKTANPAINPRVFDGRFEGERAEILAE